MGDVLWLTSVFVFLSVSVMFFYVHHKVTVRVKDFISKGANISLFAMIMEKFSFIYAIINTLLSSVFLVVIDGNITSFKSWFILYFVINVVLMLFILLMFTLDLVHGKASMMASDLMRVANKK